MDLISQVSPQLIRGTGLSSCNIAGSRYDCDFQRNCQIIPIAFQKSPDIVELREEIPTKPNLS
jgi:hypothetical protein